MKIKSLRIHNGPEYCGEEFDKYIYEYNVSRKFSSPLISLKYRTPKGSYRILTETSICLQLQSNLLQYFWVEAFFRRFLFLK